MKVLRITILLVLVCIGCQSGRIPCPKVTGPRLQKSTAQRNTRSYSNFVSARAEKEAGEEKQEPRGGRAQGRYVSNVSVEEWDCPKPGSRKYMPRSIRENIRRNAQLMNEEAQQQRRDSL